MAKNLKQHILQALQKAGIDTKRLFIKFYKQSPYQKARYKPEYVEQECWIYPEQCKIVHINGKTIKTHGICVTEENWQDVNFKNMIIEDIKQLQS